MLVISVKAGQRVRLEQDGRVLGYIRYAFNSEDKLRLFVDVDKDDLQVYREPISDRRELRK